MTPAEWLELNSAILEKKIRYRVVSNAGDFKGKAGLPYLIIAANPHLSLNELVDVMAAYGCYRGRTWVSRRRWMYFDPRDVGGVRNADGQDERAYRIMDQHPQVSARELVRILQKNGIRRGKDWVLRRRVVR